LVGKETGWSFYSVPMPFRMGPVGALLLHCSLTRGRGQREAKEDGQIRGGKEEGERGHNRL